MTSEAPPAATSQSVQQEDQWLRIGAIEKTTSIVSLAGSYPVADVLEVGCGTGAILEELDRRGFAERYWACEPAADLFRAATQKRLARVVEIACSTFEDDTFVNRSFDLIVLSHVLEHIAAPAELLARAIRRARLVLVEVPLEGNYSSSLRAKVRESLVGRPRTENAAGHVQFFARADIHKLVTWCGGEIVASRLYFPSLTYAYMRDTARGYRRILYRVIEVAYRVLGDTALAHLYYAHLAVLVRVRPEAGRHQHPLFWRP